MQKIAEFLLTPAFSFSVPIVVESCAECIEKFGMVDGIYRLSGIASNIKALK